MMGGQKKLGQYGRNPLETELLDKIEGLRTEVDWLPDKFIELQKQLIDTRTALIKTNEQLISALKRLVALEKRK
jgi:hypothetical protein